MLWPLTAAAQRTPEEIRRAVDDVLSDPRFQRELPDDPEGVDISLPWLGSLGPILEAILLVFVCVGLVIVGFIVVRSIRERRRARAGRAEERDEEPATDLPALPDADAAARAGDFTEAMHRLLLCALILLAQRGKRRLPPALTSREIVRSAPLSTEARAALGELVRSVEVTLFGGRSPGELDYRACVASLDRFEERLAEVSA